MLSIRENKGGFCGLRIVGEGDGLYGPHDERRRRYWASGWQKELMGISLGGLDHVDHRMVGEENAGSQDGRRRRW